MPQRRGGLWTNSRYNDIVHPSGIQDSGSGSGLSSGSEFGSFTGGVEISKAETWDDVAKAFGVEVEFLAELDNGRASKRDKCKSHPRKKRIASQSSLPFVPAEVEISKHAIERLIERSDRTDLNMTSAEKWARELLAQSKEEKSNSRSSMWGRTLRQAKHTIPARYFIVSRYRFVMTRNKRKWVVRTVEPRGG